MAGPLHAQRDARVPGPDPELERKTFKVADGFEVNLFAADPLLAKPIQINFDPQGHLWVACSEAYPQIKPGQKQNDKIIVLEDRDGDGKADNTTVFAEGLLIPTGLAPGDGGVYVVDSTDLLHLADTDGDGKADKRRVILSGFGTEDTHHMVHTLRWGPDGLLYFNQSIYIHSHIETPHGVRRLGGGGVWQFRPASRKLEVFARGWVNAWGHHFDRYGQSFVTDGAGGEGINYVVPGASYPTAVGASRVLNGLNPGSPKYCGGEVLSGRHLPEAWRGNIITNDFRGHRVCRFVLSEDGSGFAAQEKSELIKSSHPAFRPIDVKMGPDGAIYIADWYNPIIQHGEVDFRDPRRDQTHGRIWRVTAKGRSLVSRPKLGAATVHELLDSLKAPEDWTRTQARRVLQERGAKTVLPALAAWVKKLDPKDKELEEYLLEALWTYQALDVVEPDLLVRVHEARDPRIRAAATRVTLAWLDRLADPLSLLSARVADEYPRVRLEAVRALAGVRSPRAVELALRALDRPMDHFLDYALWLTINELQPVWLPALQKGELSFGGNVKYLAFALQAAGSPAAVRPLVDLVRAGKVPRDREESVLTLIAALGSPQDLSLVLDLALAEKTADGRKTALLEGLAQAARQRKVRPDRDLGRIASLLASGDDALRASTARLAGLWRLEPLRPRLTEVAKEKQTSPTVRRAVLESLIALGGKASRDTLEQLTAAKQPAEVRRMAVVSLAELDVASAAKRAADFLASSPPDIDPSDVINAFLQQKKGDEALASALVDRKLPPDVAKVALRTARASGRDVTALAEALTKAGGLTNPVRVLSPKQLADLVAEVAKRGDAVRGEAVFRRKDQACLKCHAIAGAGGQVGPDLVSIGASAQVDYLIESLLLPNKAIKEGYHSLVVTTKKGQILTGVKVRQSNRELILRNAEDKEISIPLKEIDTQENGGSLMPEGLNDTLTRGELVDLVRFLSELGKVGPFQVGKERVVRRWQVLEPEREAYGPLYREGIAATASDAPWQTWSPAYSNVAGSLPLADVPMFRLRRGLEGDTLLVGAVRCQLEVTTPGKVKLLVNATDGIRLWVGGTPVEVRKEIELDLKQGLHTLTYGLDLGKRREALRVEVAEVKGSPAQVRVVGGK
ncbi:MAG: HEAT repeat domain-containing protein [Planctomycetes bacterium]|nr:HEAT repeat domain-containing protein [Planctomycetota bacterium]